MNLDSWSNTSRPNKNWEDTNRVSNWITPILTDLENSLNLDHFSFGYETKKNKRFFNFTFLSLNEMRELMEFNSKEKITTIKL